MSKSKAELSISARLLLDYIVFRRKFNHTFFENNETIGFKLDLTEGTIKELVNRLVRMGYLVKGKDKYGRRVLETTALKHKPLFYPLQEINKRGLKEELEHQTKELEKAEQLANDYLDVIEKWRNRYYDAERKIAELQRQLNALQSTPTPQINNTTSNTEQSFNNNEGIVRVDNISVEGNLKHNNDALNTANTDVFKLIDGIMSKYKIQKSN